MTKAFYTLAILAFGGGVVAVSSVGCEVQDCEEEQVEELDGGTESGAEEEQAEGSCVVFKSTERCTGAVTESMTRAWESGQNVTIDAFHGDVEILRGTADELTLDFTPFSRQAHDADPAECEDDFNSVHFTMSETGDVAIDTFRDQGETDFLGAHIRVHLPENFDAALNIDTGNGTTQLNYLGAATALDLVSGLGPCNIITGSTTSLNVLCNNDLDVFVSGVPEGLTTGLLSTDFGNIIADFPTGPAYAIQAFAEDGTVDEGNAEAAGCDVNTAAAGSKTISCGGGVQGDPLFQVTANAVTPEITLSFR